MSGAMYAGAITVMCGVIAALVWVESLVWRRKERSDVDVTWQSFSDGRWR